MADSTLLETRYQRLLQLFNLEQLRLRASELKELTQDPALWEDQSRAVILMAEDADVAGLIGQLELLELLLAEGELDDAEKELVTLERRALLSGPHDTAGALISIHAGTGGVDAQDWAAMLLRQYLRFVEQGSTEAASSRPLGLDRSKWKAELVDKTDAEEAGLKSATIEVTGRFAYGLLKGEGGVHRLVRLSPFNAKSLRQTSFALLEVLPVLEASEEAPINDDDLRIDVYRASGKGGQGVNTTDSAVRITHLPSGIVVAVQNERSQHQNKATAMKILQARLAKLSELRSVEERAMLRGELKEGSWGNQIRSTVLQPYQMVKDHRTEVETSDTPAVLDGKITPFIEGYLTWQATQQS